MPVPALYWQPSVQQYFKSDTLRKSSRPGTSKPTISDHPQLLQQKNKQNEKQKKRVSTEKQQPKTGTARWDGVCCTGPPARGVVGVATSEGGLLQRHPCRNDWRPARVYTILNIVAALRPLVGGNSRPTINNNDDDDAGQRRRQRRRRHCQLCFS